MEGCLVWLCVGVFLATTGHGFSQTLERGLTAAVWVWNDSIYCRREANSFLLVEGNRRKRLLSLDSSSTIVSICPYDSGVQVTESSGSARWTYEINCLSGSTSKTEVDRGVMAVCKNQGRMITLLSVPNEKSSFGFTHRLLFNSSCLDSNVIIDWQFLSYDGKYVVWSARGFAKYYDIAADVERRLPGPKSRSWARVTYGHDTLYCYKGTSHRKDFQVHAFALAENAGVPPECIRFTKVPVLHYERKELSVPDS